MAAFYDQLHGRARKVVWMTITAGTSLLLLVFAWLALRYVLDVRSLGTVTPALRAPVWIGYAVVPVGLALGAIEYALAAWRNVTLDGVHASVELEEDDLREDDPS
jgi:TRAP-type C4-dicarboxylate transport system permease small subunit